MKKFPAFTIPFYEFNCDPQLTNDILQLATDSSYNSNQSNKISAEKLKHKPLIEWIENCLQQLRNDLYDSPTFDIKVTDCWLNKSSYTEKHHLHSHANSLYSGILYLTSHDKKSTTKFFFPNPFYNIEFTSLFKIQDLVITSKKTLVTEITPEAGKLIIFPSHIQHETTTNITRDNRYTVAFNSFVSGKIGLDQDQTALQITTRYLEDE
jgi:uncharacterized protein (TIGR02466 family)